MESSKYNLTHLRPMPLFNNPWKHQETRGFLMFSGAIEREHFLEIIKGNIRFYKFYNISFYKFLILILCFSWMLKIAYVLFPRRSMVMLSNFRLISQCLTPTKLHLNSNFQKICIHNWIWKLGRRYLMYVGNLCLEVWTVF